MHPSEFKRGFKRQAGSWGCSILFGLAATCTAAASCRIDQLVELKVNVVRNRAYINGEINGQPVKIVLDTGSADSVIGFGAAKRLNLPIREYRHQGLVGVGGGEVGMQQTRIKHLKLGPLAVDDLSLNMIDTNMGEKADDTAFLLGDDFFSKFTTEWDLARGFVRFLAPHDCRPEQLVYWGTEYFLAELKRLDPRDPHIQVPVLVNDRHVDATLDSGAPISVISLQSAADAGLKWDTPGVVPEDPIQGIAGVPVASWLGTFSSFALGNETIRNAKLRISDLSATVTDMSAGSIGHIPRHYSYNVAMLLGADFLLSHRVVVDVVDRKLLFTYNGGRVFQVQQPSESQHAAPDATPAH